MTSAFDALMSGITTGVGVPAVTLPALDLGIVEMAEGYDYKPYQREALEHVFSNKGKSFVYGYVGLDMGLGKSVVAGGIAASVAAAGVGPTLAVVPPSLRTNLAREIARFFPHLTVETLHGRGPADGYTLPAVDVLILGDSSLSGQGKRGKNEAPKMTWVDFLVGRIGALVVDEAHRFKNKSARSEALVSLATCIKRVQDERGRTRRVPMTTVDGTIAAEPRVRVPMSGTMTPNGRNGEIAQQVSIMGRDAWNDIGGEGLFWKRYNPKVDQYSRGNAMTEELHHRMASTWYFRRLRDDVEDLPNKGRTGLHLDGRGSAVAEYKRAEKDLMEYLRAKQDGYVTWGQQRAQAIVKLNVLRRLAGRCKTRAIIEHVKELLEDTEDEGVFIVAEHSDVIDDLVLGLVQYEPAMVRGGMTDKQKDAEVNAFVTGEARVMVGQITAAGVGLTLHGGGRNRRVIVAQLPWTPAELRQAEDRLHRLGQTRDVFSEVALCAIEGTWTIDERLWGQLESKNFNASTLQDGAGDYLLDGVVDSILESYRS